MDIQRDCMFKDESDDVKATANQRRATQSNLLFPEVLLWSPSTYIYSFHKLDGNTYRRIFSVWEMATKVTEIRLSPSPVFSCLPSDQFPYHQKKIINTGAEALPFYRRLSDACVIMSHLDFDRLTRERLVLQGKSMALGHIPINRLPQLLMLMLPLCDR